MPLVSRFFLPIDDSNMELPSSSCLMGLLCGDNELCRFLRPISVSNCPSEPLSQMPGRPLLIASIARVASTDLARTSGTSLSEPQGTGPRLCAARAVELERPFCFVWRASLTHSSLGLRVSPSSNLPPDMFLLPVCDVPGKCDSSGRGKPVSSDAHGCAFLASAEAERRTLKCITGSQQSSPSAIEPPERLNRASGCCFSAAR
mmetsp:Transcript_49751/g.131862  ORF Transcript_49751/g.131862 Transcript_49751/m.131862 type:complete len:203 (+) Transcript_49751:2908-3516(+)